MQSAQRSFSGLFTEILRKNTKELMEKFQKGDPLKKTYKNRRKKRKQTKEERSK